MRVIEVMAFFYYLVDARFFFFNCLYFKILIKLRMLLGFLYS